MNLEFQNKNLRMYVEDTLTIIVHSDGRIEFKDHLVSTSFGKHIYKTFQILYENREDQLYKVVGHINQKSANIAFA